MIDTTGRESPEPSRGAKTTAKNLAAALKDLAECHKEAEDEGYEQPCEAAFETAERLIHAMYDTHPERFEVYPTRDREVVIDSRGAHQRRGRSTLVLCESDGGVLCLVNLDGVKRRAHYDAESAKRLPDGFIRDALDNMNRPGPG